MPFFFLCWLSSDFINIRLSYAIPKHVDQLKLDIDIIRCRLTDLEVERSHTKPKLLDQSPTFGIVGKYCWGVVYKDETVVQFFQVEKGDLV